MDILYILSTTFVDNRTNKIWNLTIGQATTSKINNLKKTTCPCRGAKN